MLLGANFHCRWSPTLRLSCSWRGSTVELTSSGPQDCWPLRNSKLGRTMGCRRLLVVRSQRASAMVWSCPQSSLPRGAHSVSSTLLSPVRPSRGRSGRSGGRASSIDTLHGVSEGEGGGRRSWRVGVHVQVKLPCALDRIRASSRVGQR